MAKRKKATEADSAEGGVLVVAERKRPGPVTLFPNKVRKPISFTATEEHRGKLFGNAGRLKVSTSDFLALLVDKYADVVAR